MASDDGFELGDDLEWQPAGRLPGAPVGPLSEGLLDLGCNLLQRLRRWSGLRRGERWLRALSGGDGRRNVAGIKAAESFAERGVMECSTGSPVLLLGAQHSCHQRVQLPEKRQLGVTLLHRERYRSLPFVPCCLVLQLASIEFKVRWWCLHALKIVGDAKDVSAGGIPWAHSAQATWGTLSENPDSRTRAIAPAGAVLDVL